jgi:hypothetical protein
MHKQNNSSFKQVYQGLWGECTVLRPGNGLLIFSCGGFETCTFVYNPSDTSIRVRTEILEGGRIKYMNEGLVCELTSLPEQEQYFFLKTAFYMMYCIEKEIERDMTERLSKTATVRDCSDCYIDYKAINDIISTMKKHISPAVLSRYLYDTGPRIGMEESILKN